jgi:hypothetical protein
MVGWSTLAETVKGELQCGRERRLIRAASSATVVADAVGKDLTDHQRVL